ncbi:MAG: RNA polymerase sigma factor [Planctomycetota bacterium]
MTKALETELLDLVLSGDIGSFGKLCDRYYNSIAAIAYSVLTDHHLAEDAAQETFLRALKNLKKLKSKEKFGPWLAQICRNVAKDMVKKKLRGIDTENVLPLANGGNDERENQAVKQAIGRLSVSERELIVLRYYNNMSHEQMSSVLGLSKAAINNRLVRSRKKIAKHLRSRKKIAKHLKNNGFAEIEL